MKKHMGKKEPHVVVEKRFIFKLPRTSPRKNIGTKEMKRIKREVELRVEAWQLVYGKKRGVIGPDGHPNATVPTLSPDKWTAIVQMKMPYIVHRHRAMWEKLQRHAHPRSILLKLFRMDKKEESDED